VTIFGGGKNPYMLFPKRLPGRPRDALAAATYQIVPGARGVPMAQLDLRFLQNLPAVSNPDMALALLVDRSGSMSHTYADGHVFNAANAILQRVTGVSGQLTGADAGFDIAFYDTRPTYAGRVSDVATLRRVIDTNTPRDGGTLVSAALRGTIERYRGHKKGIYVIVITDGEFADKAQVERLVLDELLPQVTPQNPNAVRLHFVGAGEEVDHEFLERLETEAIGRGVPLVRQHHHAHLRHAHASMIDELELAYIGVGRAARLDGAPGVLTAVGDLTTRQWHDGATYEASFLPHHALLGLEYASPHPPALDVRLHYTDAAAASHDLSFSIPLPASSRTSAAPAGQTPPPGRTGGLFHLPWGHGSPEERAARDEAARRAQETRQAELARASADAGELARGGIPVGAQQRLRELSAREGSFTSDLDSDELGLLRTRGFAPRGLVTGSAMYHVGQAYASGARDSEVHELSNAYNTAMGLAVSRLEQEVTLLGAHGAVGVRLTMARHEWAEGTVEVQIVGTAVTGPGSAPKKPWLSDLSGQEWWALQRAGYEPASLVYGHCTWFVLTNLGDEQIKQSYANREFPHRSKGLSSARRIALVHLTTQARAAKAHGVTGVTLSRRVDEVRLTGSEYEHHTIVVSIIGTAVRLRADAPKQVVATTPMLSLRDGRLTPVARHERDVRLD